MPIAFRSGISIFILQLYFFTCMGQQVDFYQQYAGNGELSFLSIDTVHDSGYIIGGREYNLNGGNYVLLKTDSAGNELWRKTATFFNGLDSSTGYYQIKFKW